MILNKMRSSLWKLELGFWIMAWYVFGPSAKWSKCIFYAPEAEAYQAYHIILLDSSHDSENNEVQVVKIGARVLDLQLNKSFWAQISPN